MKFTSSKFKVAIGLVLVIACAAYFGRKVFEPRLRSHVPVIATTGLDPAIAKVVNEALNEVKHEPNSGSAWGKLGSVLMHYEFVAEAHMAFEHAEQLSLKEPRWRYLHALLLMNSTPDLALSKLKGAVALIEHAEEATGVAPTDTPRLRLAQLLLERGHDAEAKAHCEALLRQKPNHAPALLGLARISFQQGRLSESTNLLSRCVEDAHTARAANALLASVQRALGNIAGAEEVARKSSALSPDQPWPDPFWDEAAVYRVGRKALIEDATTLMDQGRVSEALQILTKVARDYPNDDEAWYFIGWAYNQQQQPLQAERALREHLQRSPRSAKGHSQLAIALLNQKRFAEATNILQAALQLKSTWRELHYNLGYACAHLGHSNEAILHLRNALERDPNYLPTYFALAELLIRRGQTDEARRLLGQALDLSPSDDRAKALLKQVEAR